MNADPVHNRAVPAIRVEDFRAVAPRPAAPAISIVEHVRRQTPVVTDDRLALQAWVERRDPR